MGDALRLSVGGKELWTNAQPSFTNFTIDATGEGIASSLQSPYACTITDLGFRVGTITGNPNLQISLQSVTSEHPSGTILGGTANGKKVFNPGASGLAWSNNTWHWLTLDETVTLTRGQLIAITLEDSSGLDASNLITASNHLNILQVRWLKGHSKQASTWSRTGSALTCMAMKTNTGLVIGHPISGLTNVGITSASSPREVALKFKLDSTWGGTFKILGARLGFTAGTGAMTLKLYDGGGAADTTVLQDITANVVDPAGAGNGNRNWWTRIFDETTLSTLTYGNFYRLALAHGGTGTLTTEWLDVDSAGDKSAYEWGPNCSYSSRNSGGNWTDVDTRLPWDWNILLDDITGAAGGLLTHPGMGGGCRG